MDGEAKVTVKVTYTVPVATEKKGDDAINEVEDFLYGEFASIGPGDDWVKEDDDEIDEIEITFEDEEESI